MTRKRSNRARPRQLVLPARSHGGARKGAGRKRRAARPRVVHRMRPDLDRNHPVHVTIRIREGVPRLRTRAPMRAIVRVFRAARGRFGLRVVQFAVLDDHLHLLVEAEGRASLTRGMRGLGTRLAWTLPARTWLLVVGWRRHGRIDREEVPGRPPPLVGGTARPLAG